MTYSPTRYWFAMTALVLITAMSAILLIRLQPAYGGLWVIVMAAACGAMGLLAYSSRDEIQRQNRMHAWYWGGAMALLFGLVPSVLLVSNATLQAAADILHHPAGVPDAARHAPKVYFSLGVMATLVAQAAGNYLFRFVQRLRS